MKRNGFMPRLHCAAGMHYTQPLLITTNLGLLLPRKGLFLGIHDITDQERYSLMWRNDPLLNAVE